MSEHDEYIKKLLSSFSSTGTLKSRESNTVEFKENFNIGSTAKYAKTMAAYANNRGGYIIFGVSDNPRMLQGLSNNAFDNIKQEKLSDTINSMFAPEIVWELGSFEMKNNYTGALVKIGWIYAYESERKPVMALRNVESERITSGEVLYRYRGRSERIKYAEMTKIIETRVSKEREGLLKLLEVIKNTDTASLGIVNYADGHFSTPYGVDVTIDKKLVTKVLRKAKYIKEGSFNETTGTPVLKVTGNIDLAEEVPVLDGSPDVTYPFIQKQLAEMLAIPTTDLYALIWHFRMKEDKKCHIEVTTSKSGKIHKFSNYALSFLEEHLRQIDKEELERIRKAYLAQRSNGGKSNG